jgi:hypothetical protein
MNSWWQAFFLGMMLGWTPSLLIFAVLLARAPMIGHRPNNGQRPSPPTGVKKRSF